MNRPNVVTYSIRGGDAVFSLNGVESFVVDAADAPVLDGWRVRLHRVKSGLVYVMCSRRIGGVREQVLLHRILVGKPGLLVDHDDRDGTNNRRSNLRPADHHQNNAHAVRAAGSQSRHRGVTFHAGRYRARIRVRGVEISLGRYLNEADAAAAYAAAAPRLHGEFYQLEAA